MNTKKKNIGTNFKHMRGFSFLELLIAMGITLVVLAAAFGIIKSMTDSSNAANQMYEITVDAQAVLNLIRRDVQRSVDIPKTGIFLPNNGITKFGSDHCDVISGSTVTTFVCGENKTIIPPAGRFDDDSGRFVLDAVTPTTVNGNDAITIIYFDELARGINAVAVAATRLELNAADTDVFSAIRKNDFIFLQNGSNSVMQQVTERSGNTINLGLNDASGINQALTIGSSVQVTLLRRVSYYLEKGSADSTWLVRQVNSRPAARIIPGVESLIFNYNIVDNDGTLDLNNDEDTGFFNANLDMIRNIRRVNVDIILDSETPAVPGVKRTVQSEQLSKIAVRRLSTSNITCSCNEEFDENLGECVLLGNGGAGCNADEYWDAKCESCNKCPYGEKPITAGANSGCGCESICPPGTYYEPGHPQANALGCVQRAPNFSGCRYEDSSCNRLVCGIACATGGGVGCVVAFERNDKLVACFSGSSGMKHKGMSCTRQTNLFDGSGAAGGEIRFRQLNNINSLISMVPGPSYSGTPQVSVVYVYYIDHLGRESQKVPMRFESGGNCSGRPSPVYCPAYTGDTCIDDCHDYWNGGFENWRNETMCIKSCARERVPWAVTACNECDTYDGPICLSGCHERWQETGKCVNDCALDGYQWATDNCDEDKDGCGP